MHYSTANEMKADKIFYVIFNEATDEVSILTTKADAAKAAGCSVDSVSRAMKKGNHYRCNGILMLFCCGITPNKAQALKGRMLSKMRKSF